MRLVRLPWRRPRVFLSSTSLDLAEHRRAVAETLRKAGLDVVTMDQFPAMASSGHAGSAEMVARTDALFGIYARRYGTVGPDGVSVTEHEYNTAAALKLPRICFVLRDTAEWPEVYTETGAGRTALDAFLARVRADVTVGWFESLTDLEAIAAASASEYRGDARRREWIRFGAVVIVLLMLAAAGLASFLIGQARVNLTREAEYSVPAPDSGFESVAARPESRDIATGHEDGRILLWPPEGAGRDIARAPVNARRIAFLNQNTIVAAGGNLIAAYGLDSKGPLWQHEEKAQLREIVVSPSAPHIAFGTIDGTVGILSADGKLLHRHVQPTDLLPNRGDFGQVTGLDYSPDGTRLVIAYLNGPLALLDTARQRFLSVVEEPSPGANTAVNFADNATVVLAHQRNLMGTTNVVSVFSPVEASTHVTESDNIFSVLEPITARRLLIANWSGHVTLWDLSRRTLLSGYFVHNSSASSDEFILDGTVRATGEIDLVTGRRLIRLRERWQTIGGYPLGWLTRFVP
jgi:hypothetical protein